MSHIPVLLNEILEMLDPKPGENFIDATINGGGHARAILERILPDGKLLGIEWDQEVFKNLKMDSPNVRQSVERGSTEYSSANVVLINDNYINLKTIVVENNFQQFNGILFDLGMSNWHVEASGKGFSFLRDEPLDMRYDTLTNDLTANEVVNRYSQSELEKIIREYGEESFARVISEQIARFRKQKPILTTIQLVETIKDAVPAWYRNRRIHFATKTFQALRIEVNHELENIKLGIQSAIDIAPTGCRIAVITFHSLEDRIVKNLFKESAQSETIALITKKPIATSYKEIKENPKSRSAKLRAVTKN